MTLIVGHTTASGEMILCGDTLIDWDMPEGLVDERLRLFGAPKIYLVSETVMVGYAGNQAHLGIGLIAKARAELNNSTGEQVAHFLHDCRNPHDDFLVASTSDALFYKVTDEIRSNEFGWVGDNEAFTAYQHLRETIGASNPGEEELSVYSAFMRVVDGTWSSDTVGGFPILAKSRTDGSIRYVSIPTICRGDQNVARFCPNEGHLYIAPTNEGAGFSTTMLAAKASDTNGVGFYIDEGRYGIFYPAFCGSGDGTDQVAPAQYSDVTGEGFRRAVLDDHGVELTDMPDLSIGPSILTLMERTPDCTGVTDQLQAVSFDEDGTRRGQSTYPTERVESTTSTAEIEIVLEVGDTKTAFKRNDRSVTGNVTKIVFSSPANVVMLEIESDLATEEQRMNVRPSLDFAFIPISDIAKDLPLLEALSEPNQITITVADRQFPIGANSPFFDQDFFVLVDALRVIQQYTPDTVTLPDDYSTAAVDELVKIACFLSGSAVTTRYADCEVELPTTELEPGGRFDQTSNWGFSMLIRIDEMILPHQPIRLAETLPVLRLMPNTRIADIGETTSDTTRVRLVPAGNDFYIERRRDDLKGDEIPADILNQNATITEMITPSQLRQELAETV